MRRIATAGLALALAVASMACSSDGVDAGNVEDKVAEQLTAEGYGFNEDEARCIAAAVSEDIGADRLAELYGEDPENPPDEVQDAIRAQVPTCVDLGSVVQSIPG